MRWGTSTRVTRARVSRWGDVRLWVGVVVLVASMFIGARVMASGEERITVWRATQDLAVGSAVQAVEPVVVPASTSLESYAHGPQAPQGILIRPVGTGELLPQGAFGVPDVAPTRVVTVPVNPLHLAAGVNSGDQVDVWATPDDPAAASNPIKVVEHITVSEVNRDVVGTGGDIGVVLLVPEVEIPALVRAMRTGVVDIVKVPLAQTSGAGSGSQS